MPDCYEALFLKYAFNPISSFESTFNSPYASHEQGQWTFISLNLLFPWSVSSSYAYIWEILWFRFLYFVCVKPLPCYHVDPLMRHLAISSLGNGIDGKHNSSTTCWWWWCCLTDFLGWFRRSCCHHAKILCCHQNLVLSKTHSNK